MKFKKIKSAFILLSVAALVASGCSSQDTAYYQYEKKAEEGLYFESSDKELDQFLNDYYSRHIRSGEKAINGMPLGDSVMFGKEWETMSMAWFDSTGTTLESNRIDVLEEWINNIPVDKYGYVWCDIADLENPQPTHAQRANAFGMGWPFPTYEYSYGLSQGWEFNGISSGDWNVSTTGGDVSTTVEDGYMKIHADQSNAITMVNNSLGEIETEHSPYMEIDFRISTEGFGNITAIDDIYISWQVEGDPNWYTVAQKEFATNNSELQASWEKHIYFPMYMDDNWGTDKIVTALKIDVKAKDGQSITGDINVNYIRCAYDTRKLDNISNFLTSAKLLYEYTGDEEMLKNNIDRYRQATMFMIENMDGKNGLVDMSNMIGHDGGTTEDVGHSIPSGYWDVLSLARYSLCGNIYFYKALTSMAYLEGVAEKLGLENSNTTIKNKQNEDVAYTYTSETLAELAETVKKNLQQPVDEEAQTGFWSEENHRFIEGFNRNGDIIDYGFVMFNLEVLSLGLATEEQAESVMEWINGDVEIEGDDATGKYAKDFDLGEYGIYDYKFAPRVTTKKNYDQYEWQNGTGDAVYGVNVQDGGAIMFVSYYDIMARLTTSGADNAFGRLKEINEWYKEVYDYAMSQGVDTDLPSTEFYRVYYEAQGINMQGFGGIGAVGLDAEFLESSTLYATVPFGFFGLSASDGNTLNVEPNLPEELDYWKMENLMYQDVKYDLTIGENYVYINSVRGDSEGLFVEVALEKPSGKFQVLVDGEAVEYEVENDRVIVKVDFTAHKIIVK